MAHWPQVLIIIKTTIKAAYFLNNQGYEQIGTNTGDPTDDRNHEFTTPINWFSSLIGAIIEHDTGCL